MRCDAHRVRSVVCGRGGATVALASAGRFSLGSRGASSGRAVSACIVVHVPAGSLEVQAGCGQRPLQLALALGAFCFRFRAKALNFFEFVTAFCTVIWIKWQFKSLRGETAHCEYSTGSSANGCKMRDCSGYCARSGWKTISYSGTTSIPVTWAASAVLPVRARRSR